MRTVRGLKAWTLAAAIVLFGLAAPTPVQAIPGDYEITELTVRADHPAPSGQADDFRCHTIPPYSVHDEINKGCFGDFIDALSDVAPYDCRTDPAQPCWDPDPVNSTLTQAGAHPDLKIRMRFCDPADPDPANFDQIGCSALQDLGQLRSFTLHLPPGMLGNPTSTIPCPTHLFLVFSCPAQSIVGQSLSLLTLGGPKPAPTPVYNVETTGLEPARLGTSRLPISPPGPALVTVSLRTAGDDGIDSVVTDIPGAEFGPVMEINTTLCAYAPCQAADPFDVRTIQWMKPQVGAKPFFVNPTSCDKPAQLGVDVRSYVSNNVASEVNNKTQKRLTSADNFKVVTTRKPAFTPTGCNQVPFTPKVTTTPDDNTAGHPSGYSVEIKYPNYTPDDIWQAQLKDAEVTLPDGVSLSPAGGNGLQSCSDAQFGYGNNNAVECPDGSKIGDVTVESPAIADILHGKAFFGPTSARGRPTAANPWKLFIVIEGAGLRIKLPPGDITISDSGQITTVFRGQPQLPFTRFLLHTNDGPNAPLMNPTTCTTHTGSVTLTGWNSTPGHPRTSTSTPTIKPEGCVEPRPFQPVIQDASAEPSQAAATSRSHLLFTVPDGHQDLKTLNLALPPGATGSLAAVPLCPASVVNALASNPSVNCPDASRVGTIRSTVGSGDGLLTVSGSVYIGEPVGSGDAASFVIVIPAKVGPIDLGRVVVVNRAVIDPNDASVDVLSPDIPNFLEGVPLSIRSIEITIDREGFFLNPSGCDTRPFVGTFTAYQGGSASASFPTAATGCDRLPFSPKLRLIAGAPGLTKKNSHPPLKAIVTQGRGEGNISKAKVVLPDIIRPNVPQFQKPGALCTDVQLAQRACPSTSLIGNATVRTPVLPFPLSGPVYIVLKPGNPLPELAVFLRSGGIEVVLRAGNGFQGIRILNTFNSVPDVPQSYFELNVNGGKNGILNAFSDLCHTETVQPIDATFTGQNGKVVNSHPKMEFEGCNRAGAAILSKSVNMSRKGVVKLRVGCRKATPKRCKGRLSLRLAGASERKSFSIKQGRHKTLKLKLSKKARKAVRKAKHVRAKASLKLRAGITASSTASKTITVKR